MENPFDADRDHGRLQLVRVSVSVMESTADICSLRTVAYKGRSIHTSGDSCGNSPQNGYICSAIDPRYPGTTRRSRTT